MRLLAQTHPKPEKQITFLYDYAFPNYYLPNATSMDLFMLNYMNSQHDDAPSPFTINNHDAVSKLFNNRNYNMAASNHGSTLSASCFARIITINCDTMANRTKYHRYVYPIHLTAHLDHFNGRPEGDNKLSKFKVNGDYFYKFMSEQAIQDVRSGKATLLLDYGLENWILRTEYEQIHATLDAAGFPAENVVVFINSLNAEDVYNEWFPDNKRLQVANFPYLMIASSQTYSSGEHSVTEKNLLANKDNLRTYHYLFKSRRPRFHRQVIGLHLLSKDNLKKGNWSYLRAGELPDHTLNSLRIHFPDIDYINMDLVDSFNSMLPKTLVGEEALTEQTVQPWRYSELNIYSNSYFYICTETGFGWESWHQKREHHILTEKVWKPVANFQPFIFCTVPGTLGRLRELGYRTFDGYIDESYDLEPDYNKRMLMILKEIDKLCALPQEEIHNWYWSQWDILVHNQRHLIDQCKFDNANLLIEPLVRKLPARWINE